MVNLNKFLNLEQLISRGRLVLFDTSALITYIERSRSKNNKSTEKDYLTTGKNELTIEQKILYNREDCQFYALLRKYLSEGKDIYVTSKVFEEFSIEKIESPYKKQIKKIEYKTKKVEYRTDLDKVKSKLNLYLARARRDAYKEERRLICDIESQRRILTFSFEETEDYEELNNRLSLYRNDFTDDKGPASDTDWDFLLSGIAISKSRNLVSLVTNDKHILDLWKLFIKKNIISLDQIDFFARRYYNCFKMAELGKATYRIAIHNL